MNFQSMTHRGRGGWRALFAALLLGVVFGTGCGSSDDATLTKAEFVQQGDAICQKAQTEKQESLTAEFAKKTKSGTTFSKAEEQELITDLALPPIQRMTEELSDLDAPEGKEPEAFIAALEKAVQEVEDDPAAALTKSEEIFAESDKRAKALGFKVCSLI
jgi:hypothetical protein